MNTKVSTLHGMHRVGMNSGACFVLGRFICCAAHGRPQSVCENNSTGEIRSQIVYKRFANDFVAQHLLWHGPLYAVVMYLAKNEIRYTKQFANDLRWPGYGPEDAYGEICKRVQKTC